MRAIAFRLPARLLFVLGQSADTTLILSCRCNFHGMVEKVLFAALWCFDFYGVVTATRLMLSTLLQWHLGRGIGFYAGFYGALLTTAEIVNKKSCAAARYRRVT